MAIQLLRTTGEGGPLGTHAGSPGLSPANLPPQRSVRHPGCMRHPLASAATSLHTAGSRPEDCHLSKFFKGNTRGIWHAHCSLQMQMIQPSCASYGGRLRCTPPNRRRARAGSSPDPIRGIEGRTMMTDQEAQVYAGTSLPAGEPVTLVIDDERFFGWVASASPAHSLACVAIEFKRGSHRVQELIPVENIQRLRDYLQAHPELRQT